MKPCNKCGALRAPTYQKHMLAHLEETGRCLTCYIFESTIARLRASGRHTLLFYDGAFLYTTRRRIIPRQGGEALGFGGAEYKVMWLDGSGEFETNDLYYDGKVPDAFRDEYPDNCTIRLMEYGDMANRADFSHIEW